MYGLVLEGGGAKGAFHIGAYRALRQLNIEITGVAGTSIGAINGAMIVQGKADRAHDLWYNISPAQLFNMDDKYFRDLKQLDFNKKNISYLATKLKNIMNNRGLDITPIKKLLRENIDEKTVRESEMEFGIVTVSLSDIEPLELFIEDIPRGKLIDYLLASANLPAFRMEKMDGKFFLDGGFYDNLPVRLLVRKGFKQLIAIRTFGLGRTRDINTPDIDITYIQPSGNLGRVLDFDQEQARTNLKMGYYDTLKTFNSLQGQKYYIDSDRKEVFFFEFLKNLGKDNILKAGEKLGYQGVPGYRVLFEYIIPRLTELMDINRKADYRDIAISFVEWAARKAGVDRFEIYSFPELLASISRKLSSGDISRIKNEGNIPSFIKTNELLSRTVKEELISEVIFTLFSGIIDQYRE